MAKIILAAKAFENELLDNILPFWMTVAPDPQLGGFYGGVNNDLVVHNEIPRTSVLCARILWTFSRAYQKFGNERYLKTAKDAYEYLNAVFWDADFGGLYWSVDMHGKPVQDRKHHYSQAFAIYGLCEYYRATKENASLDRAIELFDLLEEHAYEPQFGGYIEGSSRNWSALPDMRLSANDMNCHKSMNTMLHILEAYTTLASVWEDSTLTAQLKKALYVFSTRIIDPETGHFFLFFNDDWTPLCDHISFGHEIEGSWLLCEAAEATMDAQLLKLTQEIAVRTADAVLSSGREPDGSIIHESNSKGVVNSTKEWWTQAEAVLGFYNAFQLKGQVKFLDASTSTWKYIQEHMVDHKNGGWFTRLYRDGSPDPSSLKIGPWECPYHQSRLCLEMMDRLAE